MKTLFALGTLLIGCTVGVADEVNATSSTNPDASKAAEWVRQLADSRFQVRAAAARELIKLGRSAKPALLDGMRSPDPEVWNRCSQLLPEALAADLKARVDAFLDDADGKKHHDLPLMDRYRKVVGADLPARKLFAEMLKTHASFLEACESNSDVAAEKYLALAQDLQISLNRAVNGVPAKIKMVDLSALFLVGADPELLGATNNKNGAPVSNLLWQQDFQSSLLNGEMAAPFRKLFFNWADNRSDVNSISQTLSVIQNVAMNRNTKDALELKKEGLEYAIKVMKLKDLQIWTRAQAMTCVGRMGGKEHVPAFEALFDDKVQLTNIPFNQINISTQMNDIALAMAIHLSGQQPKDYGFDALQTNPNMLWSYHFLGFSSEEKRVAAFKKYAERRDAEQKKMDDK